jgi:hypothetical protein
MGGVAVRLLAFIALAWYGKVVYIYIQEEFGSNTGRHRGFSWFYSALPVKCRGDTTIIPEPLPSESYPGHRSRHPVVGRYIVDILTAP